jgi:hypothetical protein
MGVAFPWNSASGINSTTPVLVLRFHVPSFAITTAVELHAGAVSDGSQSRMRDGDNAVPWSFESGE